MLNYTEERIGNVFSTIIFFLYTLYLQLCLLAGFSQIKLRFLTFVDISSLKPNATWNSSFLSCLMIFLISNGALSHFYIRNLRNFTAGTEAQFIFKQEIETSPVYGWLYSTNFFEILILGFGILSWLMVYIWTKCCFKRNTFGNLDVRKAIKMKVLKHYDN